MFLDDSVSKRIFIINGLSAIAFGEGGKGKIMAVKLRLMRMGRRHKPFFRLNAVDIRTPRGGKIIEKLGHYDPIEKNAEKQIVFNKERIEYWLGVGAVPTETAAQLIAKIGIVSKHYREQQARRKRARLAARKKGLLFDNTQRLLAKKASEKAEAEGKAKAEAEVKAKTETEAKPETEAKTETEATTKDKPADKQKASE